MDTRFSLLKSRLALTIAVLLWVPGVAAAQVEIYSQDFNSELPGVIPDSGNPTSDMYRFFGPTVETQEVTDPQFEVDFTHEITDRGGNDLAYTQTINGSHLSQTGGPFYFYSGFGGFLFFEEGAPMPSDGMPGSENPGQYRFSADVKVTGSTVPMPIIVTLSSVDNDYDATHGIDGNGNGNLTDGAAVYQRVSTVSVVDGADYATISLMLDQGTLGADVNVLQEHRVFSSSNSLLWQINWGAAEFGLDDGNLVSVDNVKIEFLDLVLVPGDYNENGIVDAADYVLWRNYNGTDFDLSNEDPNNMDGMVTQEDYNFWRSRFGATSGAGSVVAASGQVPEPSSVLLVLCAAIAVVAAGRRFGS